MKLTGKIVLIYMLVMALLTVCFGYSIVRREREQLQEELSEKAEGIGDAMEQQLVIVWHKEGNEGIARLIRRADRIQEELTIRWIAIDRNRDAPNLATSLQQLSTAIKGDVFTVASEDRQRMYYPIDDANIRAGYLEFSQPMDQIRRYTRGTIYHTGTLILGMLLCGGVFTLLGIRTVGQRLEKLIDKTKQIGRGDFSRPVQLRGNDELNELAAAINTMSRELAEQHEKLKTESMARLAAVEQLRHVDRLNTVGRLASGVAHELGTPLNVVSGRAELIASGQLDEEQCHDSALTIKSEADRMTNIIRQLLDFARRRAPQRQSVDLRHVVEQCVDLLRPLATKHQVEFVVRGGDSQNDSQNDSPRAMVDAAQIQQVLTNLVVNAIQAMPDGGTVWIELDGKQTHPLGETDDHEVSYACLAVRDEGVGIRDDDLPHLFEPFFTTKEVGVGTGLGLSVSYGIVHDHEGWIDVDTAPGKGSCFTVFLPAE